MNTEQREEQRERRRASNDQFGSTEREERLSRRRDRDRLRRERETNEDAQVRLAFT